MFDNVICNKIFLVYGLKLLIIQLICHGVLKVLNQHLLIQEVLHHHQHLLHLVIHQKEILSGNHINNLKKNFFFDNSCTNLYMCVCVFFSSLFSFKQILITGMYYSLTTIISSCLVIFCYKKCKGRI